MTCPRNNNSRNSPPSPNSLFAILAETNMLPPNENNDQMMSYAPRHSIQAPHDPDAAVATLIQDVLNMIDENDFDLFAPTQPSRQVSTQAVNGNNNEGRSRSLQ